MILTSYEAAKSQIYNEMLEKVGPGGWSHGWVRGDGTDPRKVGPIDEAHVRAHMTNAHGQSPAPNLSDGELARRHNEMHMTSGIQNHSHVVRVTVNDANRPSGMSHFQEMANTPSEYQYLNSKSLDSYQLARQEILEKRIAGILANANRFSTVMGDVEKVGPKGYVHGWIHVGSGAEAADKLNMTAAKKDQKKLTSSFTDTELKGTDKEFARRATALGKKGQVSRTHQLVKDEIARRSSSGKPKTPYPNEGPDYKPESAASRRRASASSQARAGINGSKPTGQTRQANGTTQHEIKLPDGSTTWADEGSSLHRGADPAFYS